MQDPDDAPTLRSPPSSGLARYGSALLEQSRLLLLSCPEDEVLAEHTRALMIWLKRRQPEVVLEALDSLEADAVVQRLNEVLADSSIASAVRPGGSGTTQRIWVHKDEGDASEHDLRLLAKLQVQFPGARLSTVVITSQPDRFASLIEAESRSMLHWPLPARPQAVANPAAAQPRPPVAAAETAPTPITASAPVATVRNLPARTVTVVAQPPARQPTARALRPVMAQLKKSLAWRVRIKWPSGTVQRLRQELQNRRSAWTSWALQWAAFRRVWQHHVLAPLAKLRAPRPQALPPPPPEPAALALAKRQAVAAPEEPPAVPAPIAAPENSRAPQPEMAPAPARARKTRARADPRAPGKAANVPELPAPVVGDKPALKAKKVTRKPGTRAPEVPGDPIPATPPDAPVTKRTSRSRKKLASAADADSND